jgi:DNA-binding SARP family transcriptional activator/tetratricopeptide (TPR) repeat protein
MKPKARVVLTLLGGFDARSQLGSPLVLPTRKGRALLAYLALPIGRAHPRERLAALLWGDMPDAQARGNLRQALSRIQKGWPGAAVPGILCQGDTVALDPSAVEVDVVVLERLLADGRPAALEQAVGQYRGDLLEGLALPERAFDEWLTAERERLRGLAVKALEGLLAHQHTTAAEDQVLETARRLLELDPLQEPVHRLVIRLHWQHGRRAAALRQYQTCVDVLARELRAGPDAETTQLHQEIMKSPRLDQVESSRSDAPVETKGVPARWPSSSEPATPLVGRAEEAARFHTLLDEVGAGQGRILALVGEAGIGKSRLLEELAALAARRGHRVLWSRSYETEQVLPFGPWVDALRAGGVVDDPEVLGELSSLLRGDLARLLPELGNGPRAGALRTNPLRLFTALARVVAVAGARRPLAIVLDDFHWADDMSIRLLAFLGRRFRESATLLVISMRGDALADAPLLRRTLDELSRDAHLVRSDLEPLSREDSLRLALEAVGPDVSAQARDWVAAQAWRLAEGNPFVLLEAIRAWCTEAGLPHDVLAVPERVQRSIIDGLDRLDERARQVASVAAVIGDDIDVGLLLRASGLADDDAVAGFESLIHHGILCRDGERLGFRYERTRTAAAGLLSAPRRALLHRRAAEALEGLSLPDRLPYLALGRHYRGGEVWDKALTHLQAAGRLATSCSEYGDAVAAYSEALEVCGHLSSGHEVALASTDVQLELGSALYELGDVERALVHYRRAEAAAATIDDPGRAAWAVAALSDAHTALGQYGAAIELAHRALAASAGVPANPELWIRVQHTMVRASYGTGDYHTAVSMARAVLDTPARHSADEGSGPALVSPITPSIGIRGLLVLSLSALGHFDDALGEGTEALRIAEKMNRSPELAWANYCIGRTVLEQGNAEQAVDYLERAFALTREWESETRRPRAGLHSLADFATAALALAHVGTGQLASAIPLAAGVATAKASQFCFVQLLESQGSVLVAAQRFDEAASVVTAALETARAHGEHGHEASALRLLGDITRRRQPGSIDQALAQVDEALALADRLQMQPLRAQCHLVRAEILSDGRRREEARRGLELAIDDFRSMEMKDWLRRAAGLEAALDTERHRGTAGSAVPHSCEKVAAADRCPPSVRLKNGTGQETRTQQRRSRP